MFLLKGQSIKHVSVFLGTQSFFSHGQLYVALSRVTNPKNLKVYMSPEDKATSGEATMMNVVFKEVLVCKCPKCSLPQQTSRYWYPLIDSGISITILISFYEIKFRIRIYPNFLVHSPLITWQIYQTRVNHGVQC